MRLETRISENATHGDRPRLRPRLPSRDCSVPVKPATQGSWKTPVGENLELTVAPQAGLTVTLWRPVSEEICRLSPLPVTMLNGRPDANWTSGANVQSLKNLLLNESPPNLPVW